jgi:hypothetical protein
VDQSLEAFNTTSLQRHSTSAPYILAAARGMMYMRGANGPRADVDKLMFQLTCEEVQADIPVSRLYADSSSASDSNTNLQMLLQVLSFLGDTLRSSRAEEFRVACACHRLQGREGARDDSCIPNFRFCSTRRGRRQVRRAGDVVWIHLSRLASKSFHVFFCTYLWVGS